MSIEEFRKYHMFHQSQTAQITPSSFTTLPHSGNPTAYFTSISPNTWIIDTGVSNIHNGKQKYLT